MAVFVMAVAASAHGEAGSLSREDPAQIVSSEVCGECHLSTFEVWKTTPHARGFKTLHRKAAAEAIADKLGLRLVKRDSICLRCHYTPTVDDDQLKAAAGVTCESCHGAARDWIDVHNDYGGGGADHTSESAEHRQLRIEQSQAAGMRRPSDGLYALVSSCYGCHTVPEEALVNVGGHGTGSAGFELVEWSQGANRHNFLDSFLNGDGSVNAERQPPRLRTMYVLGRALDLEYSLRGMAEATGAGLYAKAMARRVRSAVGEVRAISRAMPLPEIESMMTIVRGVEIVPNNRSALLGAAVAVGTAAKQLLATHDGTRLAAVDPLLRGEDIADEEPDDTEDGSATVVATGPDGSAGDTVSPGPASGAATGGTPTGTVVAPATLQRANGGSAAVPAVGAFKRRVRPVAKFDTVGPSTCSGCHRHQDQAAWWFDDPHYAAADRFFESTPAAIQIARLYGIKAADMTKGNQVCMDCHGSVVSGKEKREVQDGVGCESCHGPAKQYLDPHQEGDPALGAERPGYQRALELGMRALRDPPVTARTCVECHFIVEPRLISAGHPAGRGFDYNAGMETIRHWEGPGVGAPALAQAFQAAVSARGPIPDVVRARLAIAGSGGPPSGSVVPATGSGTPDGVATDGATSPASRPVARRPRPPRPRPVDPRSIPPTGSTDLVLPPFPDLDTATIEATLRALQERLEALYEAVSATEDNP